MPLVFTWKGYRFFFFSNEGNPREPVHIHVRRGEAIAKIWIHPEVRIADAYGLTGHELRQVRDVVERSVVLIEEKWNEHFGT